MPTHWPAALLFAVMSNQVNNLSVTLFLHRSLAHRSLELHPALSHIMRFWLWLTTGMVTREWVAVHRKHHAYVDRPEDPHSPVVSGFWQIFLKGVWYYRRASQDPEVVAKFGKGTPDDWIERRLYTPHNLVGLILLLAGCIGLFGLLAGTLAWLAQVLWHPLLGASFINGVGHAFGYRNHDTDDASRNIVPWAFLAAGEELHNNHHRYPRSARFADRWYEFDLGWVFVSIFMKLRLVKGIYIRDRRYAELRADRWIRRAEVALSHWTDALQILSADTRYSLAERKLRLSSHFAKGIHRLDRRYSKLQTEIRPYCEKGLSETLERMRAQYEGLLVGLAAAPQPA